ncbi:MAG: hypothetical protein EBR90_01160 [Actinobacteria bacterium]|nr:hypothetical protein [Actinomycetota bacterium]
MVANLEAIALRERALHWLMVHGYWLLVYGYWLVERPLQRALNACLTALQQTLYPPLTLVQFLNENAQFLCLRENLSNHLQLNGKIPQE